MRSKNGKAIRGSEGEHLARVKSVACVTCDADPPSIAHHPVQGEHFITIAVCAYCHDGKGGVHGDQTMLRLRFGVGGERGELLAIAETLRRVAALPEHLVLHA